MSRSSLPGLHAVALFGGALLLSGAETSAEPFGRIRGRVVLQYDAPRKMLLDRTGSLLVDEKTQGLANAVLYLPQRPVGVSAAQPGRRDVPMRFHAGALWPRVAVLRAGQRVFFANLEPSAVRYRWLTEKGGRSGIRVVPARAFGRPFSPPVDDGRPTLVQGVNDPYRIAWWFVFDHPFAAVTDERGRFGIAGLPPGTYRFRLWHERLKGDERTVTVEVRAGEATRVPDVEIDPADLTRPLPVDDEDGLLLEEHVVARRGGESRRRSPEEWGDDWTWDVDRREPGFWDVFQRRLYGLRIGDKARLLRALEGPDPARRLVALELLLRRSDRDATASVWMPLVFDDDHAVRELVFAFLETNAPQTARAARILRAAKLGSKAWSAAELAEQMLRQMELGAPYLNHLLPILYDTRNANLRLALVELIGRARWKDTRAIEFLAACTVRGPHDLGWDAAVVARRLRLQERIVEHDLLPALKRYVKRPEELGDSAAMFAALQVFGPSSIDRVRPELERVAQPDSESPHRADAFRLLTRLLPEDELRGELFDLLAAERSPDLRFAFGEALVGAFHHESPAPTKVESRLLLRAVLPELLRLLEEQRELRGATRRTQVRELLGVRLGGTD